MKSNVIPFRLRKIIDDDLKEIFDQIPAGQDRSEIIRAALRSYFQNTPVEVKMAEPKPKPKIKIDIKPVKTTWINQTQPGLRKSLSQDQSEL